MDIDYAEDEVYRDSLLGLAVRAGADVILSYHMDAWDGDLDVLRGLLGEMGALGPLYTKLAVPCPTPFDTLQLMSLYAEYKRIILLDTSAHGLASRVLGPVLGAPFTYGYFDVPTGVNQPRAGDLVRLLDLYEATENQTIASLG